LDFGKYSLLVKALSMSGMHLIEKLSKAVYYLFSKKIGSPSMLYHGFLKAQSSFFPFYRQILFDVSSLSDCNASLTAIFFFSNFISFLSTPSQHSFL